MDVDENDNSDGWSGVRRTTRRALGFAAALFAFVCALSGVFAAFGGAEGKVGSHESIEWTVGWLTMMGVSSFVAYRLIKNNPVD